MAKVTQFHPKFTNLSQNFKTTLSFQTQGPNMIDFLIYLTFNWPQQKHVCPLLHGSNVKVSTAILFLFAKDWAVSECCKSCSDVCLKGGHAHYAIS